MAIATSVCFAILLGAADASVIVAPEPARVRPMSDSARAILDDAIRRSPTVEALRAELQRSDVFVNLETPFDSTLPLGRTTLVAVNAGVRSLRVQVNPMLDPHRRAEILGHELCHALEIARATEVRDQATLRQLYAVIGYDVGPSSFETEAARAIELTIRRELSASSSRARKGRGV